MAEDAQHRHERAAERGGGAMIAYSEIAGMAVIQANRGK